MSSVSVWNFFGIPNTDCKEKHSVERFREGVGTSESLLYNGSSLLTAVVKGMHNTLYVKMSIWAPTGI